MVLISEHFTSAQDSISHYDTSFKSLGRQTE